MNGYLIDTSILLRAWHRPDLVPKRIETLLRDDGPHFASMATFWEIAIKVSTGKLRTVSDPVARAGETNCKLLDIRPAHVQAVRHLPFHHRDPFDRMLIAQAQVEGLTILTSDRHFPAYDVALA